MILNQVDYAKYTSVYQQIVAQFGTPLFIFDQDLFCKRIDYIKALAENSFSKNNISYEFAYASKAFLTKQIAKLASWCGLSIDTCSEFEMLTALAAGVAGDKIGLHGNNKSDIELELAIKYNLARIVIDSDEEVERIVKLVKQLPKQSGLDSNNSRVKVFLRVTTGIHAGGHKYISTGHEDQKFGISLTNGQALEVLQRIIKHSSVLDLQGIHSHIGSQITTSDAFAQNAEKLLQLRTTLYQTTSYLLPEIDLGGGFGIQYTSTDEEINLMDLFSNIAQQVIRNAEQSGLAKPKILFEPGRYLIGPCMSTIYSVGTIKDVQISDSESRRYLSVDGGMSDNIRPTLYNAQYTCYIINKHDSTPLIPHTPKQMLMQTNINATSSNSLPQITNNIKEFRIVGKHCESGDILIDSTPLPATTQRGDLLVIPCTGAYGYSMASNYNLLGKPAVVTLKNNNKIELMLKRQEFEDLLV